MSTESPSRKIQSKKVESKNAFFDCVRKPDLGFIRKRPFSTDKSDRIRSLKLHFSLSARGYKIYIKKNMILLYTSTDCCKVSREKFGRMTSSTAAAVLLVAAVPCFSFPSRRPVRLVVQLLLSSSSLSSSSFLFLSFFVFHILRSGLFCCVVPGMLAFHLLSLDVVSGWQSVSSGFFKREYIVVRRTY